MLIKYDRVIHPAKPPAAGTVLRAKVVAAKRDRSAMHSWFVWRASGYTLDMTPMQITVQAQVDDLIPIADAFGYRNEYHWKENVLWSGVELTFTTAGIELKYVPEWNVLELNQLAAHLRDEQVVGGD